MCLVHPAQGARWVRLITLNQLIELINCVQCVPDVYETGVGYCTLSVKEKNRALVFKTFDN